MMQDALPIGGSLLGVILSSDKTMISVGTGNRTAYPILLSLANLRMDFRMKASNHAFLLVGLLPIPEFIHPVPDIQALLFRRVYHLCFDLLTESLKIAARMGVALDDFTGVQRLYFPVLASAIVDTPEACLIACTKQSVSPVTLALQEEFGNPVIRPPRTKEHTLQALELIKSMGIKANDFKRFFKMAHGQLSLNGVDAPFWRDWPLSDPSVFLTPELLHHWHKFFWDHDREWCCNVVGDHEIDFRFLTLHPQVGNRVFNDGIAHLKQATGRDHREVQRYMVAVLHGSASDDFISSIRALADFRYLSQAKQVDERYLKAIQNALAEFHLISNVWYNYTVLYSAP